MSAGAKYEYLWADGVKVTKPIRVPAREYVDLLMTWIEGQLNDETIFPTSSGGCTIDQLRHNPAAAAALRC